MLRELRINNFAIIDTLALTFATGMNVLTGETGAGKSIITRAIGLLCGDRAATDLIRTDADEAEIEGVFDLDAAGRAALEDSGLPPAEELLVRRVISRTGKGRVHLNGSVATANLLGQLGSRLVHVYGQLEHALLLKPESHLDLLDQFGKLEAQRTQMAAAYGAFRDAAERLATLTAHSDSTRQRAELLRFQVTELRDARLTLGEEQDLQQEREVQRHAEKLVTVCQQGEETLYSGDQAIAAALSRLAAHLQDAARIDPTFAGSADLLRQSAAQAEEVALQLRQAAERIRHDPQRLEDIEERLALLARLKRKYGCEADALIERHGSLESELRTLEGAGLDATAVRQEVLTLVTRAWTLAREVSQARQDTAARLERRMADELRALGMRGGVFRVVFKVTASDAAQGGSADSAAPGAAGLSAAGADGHLSGRITEIMQALGMAGGRFAVSIAPLGGHAGQAEFGRTGSDDIEFLVSANPGQAPKNLARVASGGELSRIMLALKALTAGAGDVPTLIFDEVDAGIGGAVAEGVGKRLHVLGRTRQILCITHLPQIAALADHHFAVEKRVSKGRTTTVARALVPEERIAELSRMLGGTGTTESQRYARRLMEGAAKAAPR